MHGVMDPYNYIAPSTHSVFISGHLESKHVWAHAWQLVCMANQAHVQLLRVCIKIYKLLQLCTHTYSWICKHMCSLCTGWLNKKCPTG